MFRIEQRQDCVAVISSTDRLDIHLGSALKKTLEDCLNNYDGNITMDLNGVAYIDSSIIGVLIHYRKKLSDVNRVLVLTNLASGIKKILELTKLISFFTIK